VKHGQEGEVAAAEVLSACGDDSMISVGIRPIEGGDDAPSDAGPSDIAPEVLC